ncbi:GTP-binding protein YPTM2 [Histomonas meleagridis]|uniref:GTP-binding protein YPTM2 n=1 Tax=Histomonas meleagridis TaxID=135588 RepID=UPI0035597083|nr:GTP-binding protein YPTM2 [Histomonas meleagridis]KAH0805593.1 GTP-binding protein YPTM2 [Histomonas meleagridis]
MNKQMQMKFIVIGESSVGKTCIVTRFCDNAFDESFLTTVGVDFKIKMIEIDGVTIKLQIWDTAGQEQFRTITKSYYRGAHGILLVFDVSKKETLTKTKMWMESITKEANDSVTVALIGNKIDLQREVSPEEGLEFAKEFGVPYFETSAKTGDSIDEVFNVMASTIKQRLDNEPEEKPVSIKIPTNTVNDKKKCCS